MNKLIKLYAVNNIQELTEMVDEIRTNYPGEQIAIDGISFELRQRTDKKTIEVEFHS